MKTILNSFFLALFVLAASPVQYARAAPDPLKAKSPYFMASSFTENEKGIVHYFMLRSKEVTGIALLKMADIYRYRTGKVPESVTEMMAWERKSGTLFEKDYPYAIDRINSRAGYIHLSEKNGKGSLAMAYWNMGESKVLLVSSHVTCDLVCETDEISFDIYKGDENAGHPVVVKNGKTIDLDIYLEDIRSDRYFLRDKNSDQAPAFGKWGTVVELPEKGTDIIIRLAIANVDSSIYRGNCVKLVWNKEKASFKIQPPSWCN